MKKISPIGFALSMMGVMAFVLMVIGSYSYIIDHEIVQLSANQPQVVSARIQGRVAGASIEATEQATLIIDNGTGEPLQVSFPVLPDMTVEDILNQVGQAFDLTVDTVSGPAGVVVRGIGDRVNGTDFYFWRYAINDKTPLYSINRIMVRGNDVIRFYFVKEYQE